MKFNLILQIYKYIIDELGNSEEEFQRIPRCHCERIKNQLPLISKMHEVPKQEGKNGRREGEEETQIQ